ncbi:hypothetical protein IJ579_05920 [bacterium]|nr:hypothetical protein [bacterium]MBQ8460758.1 hypothetical protein [bacterium]MBR1425081.1 hypothetical protein [bacterium]
MNGIRISPVENSVNFGEKIVSTPNDKKGKNGISTPVKVLSGLVGLAAITTGVLMARRSINLKNAQKLIREMAEKVNALPAQKSENAGRTVEETIANILGKDSRISPHTYDVSQEYHTMHVLRNYGGYRDGILTRNGVISTETFIGSVPVSEQDIICDASGNFGRRIKNKVVSFNLPDPARPEDTSMVLTLISPNSQYTPAQKDLLKIIENKGKIDVSIWDKIFKFKNANDENGRIILENVGKYENLDYDLILSVIQSLAKTL